MWDMQEGFGTCATPLGRITSWVTGIGIVTDLPKAVLKSLHQSVALLGGGRTGKRGVQRKEVRPSGGAFEQDTGTLLPQSPELCSSLSSCHDILPC